MKHRGEILSKAIAKSQLKKTTIAKLFGISTRYLYDLVKLESIPNDDMIRYCQLLGFDLITELPEITDYQILKEPAALYKVQANYREKYFELLEKHIAAIEELDKYKQSGAAPNAPTAPKVRQTKKKK